jgi:hypothetical protein
MYAGCLVRNGPLASLNRCHQHRLHILLVDALSQSHKARHESGRLALKTRFAGGDRPGRFLDAVVDRNHVEADFPVPKMQQISHHYEDPAYCATPTSLEKRMDG